MSKREEIGRAVDTDLATSVGIVKGLVKAEKKRGSVIPEELAARNKAIETGRLANANMHEIELEEQRTGNPVAGTDIRLKNALSLVRQSLEHATDAMNIIKESEKRKEKSGFLDSFMFPFEEEFSRRLEKMGIASRVGRRLPTSVSIPRERAVVMGNEAVKLAYEAGSSKKKQKAALAMKQRAYEELEQAERAFDRYMQRA